MVSFLPLLAVLAGTMNVVSAHYRFTNLIVNGQNTGEYVHVRRNTNHNSPVESVSSNDLRCNVGGSSSTGTQTATVAAGSTVGFAMDQAVYHDGPAIAWLSRATGDIDSYDGSGQWAKIWQVGAQTGNGQISFPASGQAQFTFQIPACTPPGDYLLRIEQIGLHVAQNPGGAQFYISCAQIRVTGGGGGSFSPTVSLPGAYSPNDPGLQINIYYPIPTSYTIPGGPIASC